MQARTLVLLIVLAGISVFAAVNWTAFTTPTTLSLLVATVEAPLGLIMLGLTILLAALFFMSFMYMQTSMLLEARRHARELQAQRALADKAEASRFTELQAYLAAELLKQGESSAASHTDVLARLDRLEGALRAKVEQMGNALSAYIGELEDRMAPGGGVKHLDRPG